MSGEQEYIERLNQLFEKYGVSQREAARRADVHHVTVYRILRGDYASTPEENTLLRLMKAIGCSGSEQREVLVLAGYQHQCEAVRLLRQLREVIHECGAEAIDAEMWAEVDRVIDHGAVKI
jgi:transcriptional regulator with XRE-family HTH domain